MEQAPISAGPLEASVRQRVPNRLRCWLNKTADQMLGQASCEHARTKSMLVAFAKDVQEARDIADEQEKLLLDWLQFASDVTAGCAASNEWLKSLRDRTWRALSD